MKQKLKEIHNKALTTLSEIKQMKELEEAKVKLLGKKGELTAVL